MQRSHKVPPTAPAGAQASSDEVLDPTVFPAQAVGLLAGRDPTGPFGCSASVVSSANASTVFTAAHCVKERFWTRKAVFVPGFHDGQTPYGVFPVEAESVPPQWLKSENENFDFGAMVLFRNAAGQRVGRAVGSFGLATGQSTSQLFDIYGYPASPPFDPNKQWHCQSPYMGTDPASFAFAGPQTMRVACDLTEGASGGGWLIGGHYLNGLSAYGYTEQPGYLFGPYFGQAAWKLFKRVRHAR